MDKIVKEAHKWEEIGCYVVYIFGWEEKLSHYWFLVKKLLIPPVKYSNNSFPLSNLCQSSVCTPLYKITTIFNIIIVSTQFPCPIFSNAIVHKFLDVIKSLPSHISGWIELTQLTSFITVIGQFHFPEMLLYFVSVFVNFPLSVSSFKGHSSTGCEEGLFQSQCYSISGPHLIITGAWMTAMLAWSFICLYLLPSAWSFPIWPILDLIISLQCLLLLLFMAISLY